VAAQQVNPNQKVEVSINERFKKYWLDLGLSSTFEGLELQRPNRNPAVDQLSY